MDQVNYMEKQCELLYLPNDPSIKNEAQQNLSRFIEQVSIVDFSIQCLQYSRNQYLIFLALTQLNRQLDSKNTCKEESTDQLVPLLKNMIMNNIEGDIICTQYAIQIYVRLVLDKTSIKTLMDEAIQLIKTDVPAAYPNFVGFTILQYLVEEVGKNNNLSLVQILRGWDFVSPFRSRDKSTERYFFEMIVLSIQYISNLVQLGDVGPNEKALKSALTVIKMCVCFDCGDEMVNIPKEWHSYLYNYSTPATLFQLSQICCDNLQPDIYECLSPMIAMGRNTKTDRTDFLTKVTQSISVVLERPERLNKGMHSFARMLHRFHSAVGRCELELMSTWEGYLGLLVSFTLFAIENCEDNTLTYVINIWPRLATQGNRFLVDIVQKYISIPREEVVTQLETVGMLFRMNYSTNYHFLKNQLEIAINHCRAEITERTFMQPPTEEKITWMVFITAHVISTGQSDDATLCVQILSLMMFTVAFFPNYFSKCLELGLIKFLEMFHKTYLGQSGETIAQIYSQISNADPKMRGDTILLVLVMNRILTYLMLVCDFEVVESTVNLLHSLISIEYVISNLKDVSSARFLLEHQTGNKLPFLLQNDPRFLPIRIKFFKSLSIMAAKSFKNFQLCLQNRLYKCLQQLDCGSDCSEELTFLCSDLRGVSSSFSHNYGAFISWVHPFFPGLAKSLQIYNMDARVCSSVLRFLLECTTNRFQRLHFDVTSPDGIYLFKGACLGSLSYASRALTKTVGQNDYYQHKIKLTNYSISCLNSALSAKYVNIAVFDVYNDKCLVDALQANLNLLLTIPTNSLISYHKFKKTVFTFLQILSADHIDFLDSQSVQSVLSVMNIVTSGIGDIDFANVASVCMSIESLFSQTLTRMPEHAGGSLSLLVSQYSNVLYEVLVAIVHVVITQPEVHVWTFARPFLSLLMVNKQFVPELEKYVCKYFVDVSPVSSQFKLLGSALEDAENNKERFIEAFSNFAENLASLERVGVNI